MKFSKPLWMLLLSAALLAALLAGCKSKEPLPESAEESSQSSGGDSSDMDTVSSIIPDLVSLVQEKEELNEDTVGWLQVPGTDIDEVVLCNFNNNKYYLRRDFEKAYSFNGVFYADRRSTFGDGSREELGANLCIYGHALTDNPDSDKYDVKFGPLHNFRDSEFAKETPYIFFSTNREDIAFEVVAVFVANADNPDLPYNNGEMEQAEYIAMVKDEILPRSIYNYDVEIGDDDKFLTLSTCIYSLEDGTPTHYPDTHYRYAILARMADPEEPLKTEASFTPNEEALVDPDGAWKAGS